MKTLFIALILLFSSCTYTITYNYNYCGQDTASTKSSELPDSYEPVIEEHIEQEFNTHTDFTEPVID